jgi:hypothetical protein
MSKTLPYHKPVTVLGLTTKARTFYLIMPAILGCVLGYFIPTIAKWIATLPWFPYLGFFKAIVLIEHNWIVYATALVGLLAGIWLTSYIFRESLVISMTDEEVHLKIKDSVQTISRSEISAVFVDGKTLVILGINSKELSRETFDPKLEEIEYAFRNHGYPWFPNGDPFEADYRLWVPDTPELSPGLHALLKAREKALKNEDMEDAKELHREASKFGITIRDKGKRQYWREQKNGTVLKVVSSLGR